MHDLPCVSGSLIEGRFQELGGRSFSEISVTAKSTSFSYLKKAFGDTAAVYARFKTRSHLKFA
jgi:hypothetical protein